MKVIMVMVIMATVVLAAVAAGADVMTLAPGAAAGPNMPDAVAAGAGAGRLAWAGLFVAAMAAAVDVDWGRVAGPDMVAMAAGAAAELRM